MICINYWAQNFSSIAWIECTYHHLISSKNLLCSIIGNFHFRRYKIFYTPCNLHEKSSKVLKHILVGKIYRHISYFSDHMYTWHVKLSLLFQLYWWELFFSKIWIKYTQNMQTLSANNYMATFISLIYNNRNPDYNCSHRYNIMHSW